VVSCGSQEGEIITGCGAGKKVQGVESCFCLSKVAASDFSTQVVGRAVGVSEVKLRRNICWSVRTG